MEIFHRATTVTLPTAHVGQRHSSFVPSYNASTSTHRTNLIVSSRQGIIHGLLSPRQTRRGSGFLQQEEKQLARATSSSVADSIPIPDIDDELEDSKFCGQEGIGVVVHVCRRCIELAVFCNLLW